MINWWCGKIITLSIDNFPNFNLLEYERVLSLSIMMESVSLGSKIGLIVSVVLSVDWIHVS